MCGSRFHSILFESLEDRRAGDATVEPDFFRDLNLDQIVDSITAGRQEYNLKPFFYINLTRLPAITYRHEVMQDLENSVLFQSISSFSIQMRAVRGCLKDIETFYYKHQKERSFLEAVDIYCVALEQLREGLAQGNPKSRGLLAFRDYLSGYTGSEAFEKLCGEAKKLKSDLSAIRYCILIKGSCVTVRNYESETDFSTEVGETFAKFQQGAVKDYRVQFPEGRGMNHIEAQVLDGVAQLNPSVFMALGEYAIKNSGFLDKVIADFDREIQFYLAYLEYAEAFTRAGLKFCYPQVSDKCKTVCSRDGFDLALAGKLLRENAPVVCNDFTLNGEERILVVTGPNQGGKTTFARTFGQLHHLATLGCPVPGSEARLFLFDRMFAHFERQEDPSNLRGKLEDDLVRIHHILQEATPNSIVIINEIFSSTTLKDAVYLGEKIMENLSELDLLCVCVTFLDELSRLNEKTVSLVAAVVPDNPTERTFRIERRAANGLAYALAISEKYQLTYKRLKERIGQ